MKGPCDVKLALVTEHWNVITACEEQPPATVCEVSHAIWHFTFGYMLKSNILFFLLFPFAYECMCITTHVLSRDLLHPCVVYFRKGQSYALKKKSIFLMQISRFQQAWPRCHMILKFYFALEICQCLWRRMGPAVHDCFKRKAIFDISVTSPTRERLGTFCASSDRVALCKLWINQLEMFSVKLSII